MVQLFLNLVKMCLLSGNLPLAQSDGELDEAGLVQTFRHSISTKRGQPNDLSVLEAHVEEVAARLGRYELELTALEMEAQLLHHKLQNDLEPLAKVEVGTIETMHTGHSTKVDQYVRHTFERPFSARPVVAAIMSSKGTDPAEARIFDVTKEGFSVTVVEAPGKQGRKVKTNGDHKSEKISFMAVVPGVHTVEGLKVHAGLLSTNATVTARRYSSTSRVWERVKWEFAGRPAAFASLNSIYNDPDLYKKGKHLSSPWMTVAQQSIGQNEGQFSIERSEVDDGSDVAEEEEIGWIAVETGVVPGKASVSFTKKLGAGIPKRLGMADALRKGFFQKRAWLNKKFSTGISLIGKSSRRGNNGGWARIFKEKPAKLCVVIDEDQASGSERSHKAEHISMAEFKEKFNDCLSTPCCSPPCADAAATAVQAADDFADKEDEIAAKKQEIAGAQKEQLEAITAAEQAKMTEVRAKQEAAERVQKKKSAMEEKIHKAKAEVEKRQKARAANKLANELLALRRQECPSGFPTKIKIGQIPQDQSINELEIFNSVQSWYHCQIKCCIPEEGSPSESCASIIFDADTNTCITMGPGYAVPTQSVVPIPGQGRVPGVFAGHYSKTQAASLAL